MEPRKDVGAYFNNPELAKAGYASMVDISTLDGQYTLGLAIKNANTMQICPQFKIPVTINQ